MTEKIRCIMAIFVIIFTQVNSIHAHAEEEMKRMSDKWRKKEAKMKKDNVAEKEKVRTGDHQITSIQTLLGLRFLASFGVLPLSRLRAYTLQDAAFYTCSYLYTGNFTISTVKSRYSHCFNCLKLFCEDREYPKHGRFGLREKS